MKGGTTIMRRGGGQQYRDKVGGGRQGLGDIIAKERGYSSSKGRRSRRGGRGAGIFQEYERVRLEEERGARTGYAIVKYYIN